MDRSGRFATVLFVILLIAVSAKAHDVSDGKHFYQIVRLFARVGRCVEKTYALERLEIVRVMLNVVSIWVTKRKLNSVEGCFIS